MTTLLTPAKQEAIKACITTDQRVEFSETSPNFYVHSCSDVKPKQFVHLPDNYSIWSVFLTYNPDTLKPEVCVNFWLD